MLKTIPDVKSMKELGYMIPCKSIQFTCEAASADQTLSTAVERAIENRSHCMNIPVSADGKGGNAYLIQVRTSLDEDAVKEVPKGSEKHAREGGYVLKLEAQQGEIQCASLEGFNNALATIKQLLTGDEEKQLHAVHILDYPLVEIRSMSTTFAWYAGYGRIGFDSQLWGLEQWKEFLQICADYKINQLNMCMYGYWPFKFEQYPETELKNIEVPVWNKESQNWVTVLYAHPNIIHNYFDELIEFAHSLSVRIFVYMGLNSYNGGYSNIYPEKRMRLPENSKFVNDFDSICISDPDNLEYLKKAVRRVVQLGVDGIVFEESEEAFWFCTCESCMKYHDMTDSPANAKHEANYYLLNILHKEIKDENPGCEVGIRAWREPPLNKDPEYLKHCRDSIPEDVCLYWAPGLYVEEDEFTKWVEVFGPERICARDSESNAWSSTQGRLLRIFQSNVLRCMDETNDQFIEKDIEQHQGSVKHNVRGINGYLFEWYGYFLHLMAHAHYGWGTDEDPGSFYRSALELLFPEDMVDDIEYVLKQIMTIHESQINIFPAEFPFLRNNVEEEDRKAIDDAMKLWPEIDEKLDRIISLLRDRENDQQMLRHFLKIQNAHKRNYAIYKLSLASLEYAKAADTDEALARKYLEEMYYWNEEDFSYVKDMFFDIYPVSKTGIRACMYPYHELKRVLENKLGIGEPDNDMIYLGVEALGWLWI